MASQHECPLTLPGPADDHCTCPGLGLICNFWRVTSLMTVHLRPLWVWVWMCVWVDSAEAWPVLRHQHHVLCFVGVGWSAHACWPQPERDAKPVLVDTGAARSSCWHVSRCLAFTAGCHSRMQVSTPISCYLILDVRPARDCSGDTHTGQCMHPDTQLEQATLHCHILNRGCPSAI